MTITLGAVSFPEGAITVRERYDEVGGRDERRIDVHGLLQRKPGGPSLKEQLDAILAEASAEDYSAVLSLRPGRGLYVRRVGFSREPGADGATAAFTLNLATREPFEYALTPTEIAWPNITPEAQLAIPVDGNAFTLPVITIMADADLVKPALSDGEATLTYDGVVENGGSLVIDATQGAVLLDGDDVTPYTSGVFPRLHPPETTLTFTTDDNAGAAQGGVWFRARWW